MSFSPRSDRRARIARRLLPAGALALLALLGCKDDLAEPTRGVVAIDLASSLTGGYEGARILVDDEVLVESVDQPRYTFIVEAGPHQFRIEKDCTDVSPAAERAVVIRAGESNPIAWTLDPRGGVLVTSDMPRAEIYLDGQFTGKTTPATLDCLQGSHVVSARLLGASAGADSAQSIVVSGNSQTVNIPLRPVAQERGALLECFTATLCPNCPVADAATDMLWADPELSSGYVGLEVHTRWGGSDPFNNATITDRNNVFRASDSGNPFTVVNGIRSITGTGNRTPDLVAADYKALVLPFLQESADVALYWRQIDYQPAQSVTGKLRVVRVAGPEAGSLADPAVIQVWASYDKDGLFWRHPTYGDTEYRRVVRDYELLGTFDSLDLDRDGDWVELDVVFDISNDRDARNDVLWSEAKMSFVGFVTSTSSKEVLQVVRARITGP